MERINAWTVSWRLAQDYPILGSGFKGPRGPGVWEEILAGAGPDGSDVRFAIHVPKTVEDNIKLPLIFSLHFGGPVKPYTGKIMMEGLVQPAFEECQNILEPDEPARRGLRIVDQDRADMHRRIARFQRNETCIHALQLAQGRSPVAARLARVQAPQA